MSTPAKDRVMSPANLIVPIKSWLELKEVEVVIRLKARQAAMDTDAIGTLHFDRFVDLHDHNHIAFFSAFDGDFKKYVQDFAKYIGPFFNALFKHVLNAPPVPVEKNVDAFVDWIAAHLLEGIGFYSAYPSLSVQDIRARARVVQGGAITGMLQSPLTVVMPAKSPAHLEAVSQLVARSLPKFYQAADAIGTVHFARFVPLGTTALAYVSEHDGDFNKHIQDLSTELGSLFDEMLENMLEPPPTPVQKNTEAFGHWISSHNKKPFLFYSAYPNLSVKDIRAGVARG